MMVLVLYRHAKIEFLKHPTKIELEEDLFALPYPSD